MQFVKNGQNCVSEGMGSRRCFLFLFCDYGGSGDEEGLCLSLGRDDV